MDKFKQWWQLREPREKKLLQYGALIIACLLFYVLFWQPINHNIIEKQQQLDELSHLNQWLLQANKQLTTGTHVNSQREAVNSESLLPIINNSLQAQNLQTSVKQLKQTDSQQASLEFSQVNFQRLWHWLQNLENSYQIKIKQLHVQRGAKVGMVKLSLTLQTY